MPTLPLLLTVLALGSSGAKLGSDDREEDEAGAPRSERAAHQGSEDGPAPAPFIPEVEVPPSPKNPWPEHGPRILPTAAILAARIWEGPTYLSVHAGIASHWVQGNHDVARTAFFVAGTLELDFRQVPLAGKAEHVLTFSPVMRLGYSVFDGDGFLFPLANLYALAGIRVGSKAAATSTRVGIGISAPILTAASLSAQAPIPSLAELVFDHELVTGQIAPTVRFGWAL